MDKMMEMEFCCGDKTTVVHFPQRAYIGKIEVGDAPVCPDPENNVLCALNSPIDSPKLQELAKGKRNALILVPDLSRKFPLNIVLPPVLAELNAGGISDENIKFLIAAGTHRAMTAAEIEHHFGSNLYSKWKGQIYNHEWWKPEQMVNLGTTPNGTPIEVNKMALESDLKVSVGAVKPHGEAGWSGGGKMIQPGVCGFSTTGATHWLAAQYSMRYILGNNENPVRHEIEQIAGQVGLDFTVNCVLTRTYQLSKAFAGNYISSQRACCEHARPYFTVDIYEKANILIAGSSSSQVNMWSTGTGPNWGEFCMKPGGTMVQFAYLKDGISKEHPLIEKYGYQPLEWIHKHVELGDFDDDLVCASHLAHHAKKRKAGIQTIMSCEYLTRKQMENLGNSFADSPQEAVDMALTRFGNQARIIAVPNFYFTEYIIREHDQ